MASACRHQQIQLILSEFEKCHRERLRKVCGPAAMLRVMPFIQPLRVMNEGECLNDSDVRTSGVTQPQSIFPHTSPMRCAVYSAPIERELLPKQLNQRRRDDHVESGLPFDGFSRGRCQFMQLMCVQQRSKPISLSSGSISELRSSSPFNLSPFPARNSGCRHQHRELFIASLAGEPTAGRGRSPQGAGGRMSPV